MRCAQRALDFTTDGRRDRARCVCAGIPSIEVTCAPSTRRISMKLGAIHACVSGYARWYAARCAPPHRTRARTRGVCSLASLSSARRDSRRHWGLTCEYPCFPYSHCSRCISQGAGCVQPCGRPAAGVRRADGVERTRPAVLVRGYGRRHALSFRVRSCRGVCVRHAWPLATTLGAADARVVYCVRRYAACRTLWPCRRSRSLGACCHICT